VTEYFEGVPKGKSMKFGVMALAATMGISALVAGCSRHKQEAVKLSNEGDGVVELDPNQAIQAYEQATQLDPSNHYILYKLAKAYKKKEEWDKVASTLARATDLAPTYANYWFERGWALTQQAKKGTITYKDSMEPYNKCIETDPNKDECYGQLGLAYLWEDDEQKSLANYTKAIEHRANNIDYYTRLADHYIRLGLYKEATQVLNGAKDIAPPTDKRLYNVHTLFARIASESGDIDATVKSLEAAKAVSGEDPGLLFNLGMAYSKLKPPKKAESLQMLKGFTARACRSKKAIAYKAHCEQAQATMQRLKGPGG
jgi:tetratricopeptide (TPR) repeat protein